MEKFKAMNNQEVEFAKQLGISEDMVKQLDLYSYKNVLHQRAFHMRDRGETITQEEADKLNNELQEVIRKLEDCGYDAMQDYMVDFDSFVIGNDYYNRFAW